MGGKIEYYDGAQWVTAGPNVKGKLRAVKIVPEKDQANVPTGSVIAEIDENAIFPGTQAVTIPAGTTAERPASPALGMLRINKDLVTLKLTCTGFTTLPNALDAASNPSVVDKLNVILGSYALTHVAASNDFVLQPPSGSPVTVSTPPGAVTELNFASLGIDLKWTAAQDLSNLTSATVVIEQMLALTTLLKTPTR